MAPTVERRLLAGFLAAGLLTALAASVAWRNSVGQREAAGRVTQTLQTLAALEEVQRSLLDAETGMRGYLITGLDDYLEPYRTARDSVPLRVRRLGRLAPSARHFPAHYVALEEVADSQLAYRQMVVEVVRANGIDSARRIVAGGAGKAGMDSVRRLVAAMRAAETRDLNEYQAQARVTNRRARATFAGLALLAAAFLMATYVVLRHHLRRRMLAEDALQRLNATLESQVEERAGELLRSNRALRMVTDCNQAMIRATDERSLLQTVADLMARDGGYPLCYVVLVEPDGGRTLRVAASAGDDAVPVGSPPTRGTEGWEAARHVVGTGEPLLVRNIAERPELAPPQRTRDAGSLHALAALPLAVADDRFGVLVVGCRDIHAFGAEEVRLLTELANDLAFGLVALRTRGAHQHAEDAVAQAKAQLEAVFESMQDGVMAFDMDGAVVLLNGAEARIAGFASPDEMKRDLAYYARTFELFQPDGRPLPVADWPVSRVLRGEVVADWELRGRRADTGQEWWYSFSGVPVYDRQGRQTLAIVVTRDVTVRHQAAEALRANEERFRSAFEHSPIGMALLAPNGRWLRVNQAVCDLLGYSPNELLDLTFQDITHADDLEADLAQSRRMLAGELSTYGMEKRYIHRSGDVVWALLSVSLVRDDRGEPLYFISQIQDITEQKRAQARLQDSERLLLASQRVARLGSYRLDVSSGWWVGSPVLREVLGIADPACRTDVAGWLTLVHPEDRESLASYFANEVLGRHRNFDKEYRIVRPTDGRERWVHGLGQLEFGADGEPTGMIGTIQDVTERKLTELALRSSELKYATVLRNVLGMVYRAFADWTAEFVTGAETLTGHTPEALNAMPGGWLSVVHPDDRAQVSREGERLRQAPASLVQTYRIVRKDGAARWVEDRKLSLFSSAGAFEEIHGIVLDIQDQKVVEEQLRQSQKMEAIGQLTGGLAHDFNNVLTVVIASAEMISRGMPRDWAFHEDLSELAAAAQRGATLVGRLLQFGRRAMLNLEPVRPGLVVANLAGMLRRLLPEAIELHVTDDSGPRDLVLGDIGSLEQMLINLCTNARDAMPDGGTLRIDCGVRWLDEGYHATHPWVAPGPYVCLAVTDTGVGMSEEVQRRVFEPFFTTKPVGQGSGLGMAMVYGLMKQHGGMAHVYSEAGRGTVVRLYFPVTASQPTDTGSRRDGDLMAARGGTETILLVEDEAAIRKTTKRALESKGYTVLVAEDGEEGLELYQKHKDAITLVVSDLVMPRLGGRQLADALRRSGATIPILFTSGYSPSSGTGSGPTPPDVGFLQKPWTLDDLYKEVRGLLDRRSQRATEDPQ